MALILNMQALGSYLNMTCEYELHILSSTKAGAAKDYGENDMKVRPTWYVIFRVIVYWCQKQHKSGC